MRKKESREGGWPATAVKERRQWTRANNATTDSELELTAIASQVTDFNQKSLSTLSSSLVQINPDIVEARKLRAWSVHSKSSG